MPLVSQTFDQLLDFTRTSAATFVGSNGLIQNTPASRNLLTWTQQFDNAAWGKSNTTIAANSTVAPDGTSTADTMLETTTSGTHIVNTVTYTGTYTFSVFVKAAGRNFAMVGNAGVGAVSINLTSGEISVSSGTVISFSATDAQNGWWRVSVTLTLPTALSIFVYSSQDGIFANRSYVGDPSLGIYVWGAQLEAASAATTYTRNNGGVFPPRFDYDPVTLAPKGLLIEEQRTNLFTYSEQFDNAAWTKSNATITANATTSPDGTVDADALIETTATGTHVTYQVFTFVAATAYTYSVYVKANGRTKFDFASLSGFSPGASFDLTAVTATPLGATSAATITAVGNGWYRCTATRTSAGGSDQAQIRLVDAAGASTYTGDGTSGIYLWGAQLEAGAFATSYIPTVASQVTRTADQCSIVAPNFAPWYNQSEGSFVVSTSPIAVDNDISFSVSNSGGYNNSIYLPADSGSQFVVVNGGSVQANIDAGTFTANTTNRVAAAYKAADFAASVNGGAVVTTASGTIPTVDRAVIGGLEANTANRFNGHIRSVRYFPVRLSNAQLQALTA